MLKIKKQLLEICLFQVVCRKGVVSVIEPVCSEISFHSFSFSTYWRRKKELKLKQNQHSLLRSYPVYGMKKTLKTTDILQKLQRNDYIEQGCESSDFNLTSELSALHKTPFSDF